MHYSIESFWEKYLELNTDFEKQQHLKYIVSAIRQRPRKGQTLENNIIECQQILVDKIDTLIDYMKDNANREYI